MAWTPLSSRGTLPLLLAGPIVRKVTPSSVTIWFATSQPHNATLHIYNSDSTNTDLGTATSNGTTVGNNLTIYAITVNPTSTLSPGNNYYYDLDFGSGQRLSNLGINITYHGNNRPSFALPPADLNQVRLVHSSCRKPHGESLDAFEALDIMIRDSNLNATNRPHQLFLTGDQIYADDVADALLYMIDDAAGEVIGWDETIAGMSTDDMKPGNRATNLRAATGFSAMMPGKPHYAKSHLLKFREYCLMYLFAWSDVLWPGSSDFPEFNTVTGRSRQGAMGHTISAASDFDTEVSRLQNYLVNLPKVRRALANIPTYMIFDDHEITDDWNLNWHWCVNVYSKAMGKRVVQNGLLAFSLFQAWGNTPEQFISGQPGATLLTAASSWRGADDSNFTAIKDKLSIPDISTSANPGELTHQSNSLNWHFRIEAPNYQIIVLDSRTMRKYPAASMIEFAELIGPNGFNVQLPANAFPNKDLNLVLASAPVIGVPFLEQKQANTSNIGDRYDKDTEAWSLNEACLERLYTKLILSLQGDQPARFAFLSGDVHYGFAARHQLWASGLFEHPGTIGNGIFVQLTASALKNMTTGMIGTMTLHTNGYIPVQITDSVPRLEKYGWNNPGSSNLIIGRRDPYLPGGSLDNYRRRGNPIVMERDEMRSEKIVQVQNVEWRSLTNYLLAEDSVSSLPSRTPSPRRVTVPPSPSNRTQALQTYLTMSADHSDYMGQWGDGKEIVGRNNMGEITFEWGTSTKNIVQSLWWRMRQASRSSQLLQPFPLSVCKVSVEFSDSRYPFPTFPVV